MQDQEIKDYLFDTLTSEQKAKLNNWVNHLKEKGFDSKGINTGVIIEVIEGTYNPHNPNPPLAIANLLSRVVQA